MSRRGVVAVVVLVLWAGGLALLARREVGRPASERIGAAGLRVTPGAAFYGVFQDERQIGFASSTLDTTDAGISITDYLVADVPVGGEFQRTTLTTRARLSRALVLQDIELTLESPAGPLRASGRMEGDSVLVLAITSGAEPPDTHRLAVSGNVLVPSAVPFVIALAERPRVGRTETLQLFDPMALAVRAVPFRITAETVFVVVDSAGRASDGSRWEPAHEDTVRAWYLVPGGGGIAGWVDEQGRLVRARPTAGLELRRTAYEMAFENWRREGSARAAVPSAAEDILETTAIAADVRADRRRLAQLRVRLLGASLRGYDLAGERQALAGDTLTVTREGTDELRADWTLGAVDTARFRAELAAEPLIQSDHPDIVTLARHIVGRTTDPRVAAERLNRWVYDSVRKRITFGIPSALHTLRTRSGDCNEHTQLYLALARAAGIPVRAASGLVYVRGKFYYHAWPEVWLGRWVALDPTLGQFPADAAHLRFAIGGLARQAELLRLVGALRVEVVESRGT